MRFAHVTCYILNCFYLQRGIEQRIRDSNISYPSPSIVDQAIRCGDTKIPFQLLLMPRLQIWGGRRPGGISRAVF